MLNNITIIEIRHQICYNRIHNIGNGVFMKKDTKKHGFTLAEVMVVLLVLTILFAAFAPYITKRRRNAAEKQEVWMWSSKNYMAGPMDIYYKPVTNNHLGGIYIGVTPDSENEIKSSYDPLSKVVVRSGYVLDNYIQKQLQLRFGRNADEDPGQLAATFLADGSNLLFGADYPYFTAKKTDISYPLKNIAFGFNALNSIKDNNVETKRNNYNTAFGTDSLRMIDENAGDNTAFGAGSGYKNNIWSQNTLVGYNAGSEIKNSINTLIGYNSQVLGGYHNTFVGANTGNADECPDCTSDNTRQYKFNVALGYNALGSIIDGTNNVAVGAGALGNLKNGNYNVAIGYNACFGITNQSYQTCIGAWSGPAPDSPVKNELGLNSDDSTQRTYIGANPNIKNDGSWQHNGKYGGDAVLEIHNSKTANLNLNNSPYILSNATTIINGNLIVKGKTFFTMGDILYPFYYQNNIFGTNSSLSCASNQLTYDFSDVGDCATLSPIANSSTSDRRLKNIKSANRNGLDKIKQLKIYNYVFKNDANNKMRVGVIAQELQNIFPNSVFKDENGYLKINTDEIFYAAINAIKELNNKIKALSKKIDSYDKKITAMEKDNEKLKKQIDNISERIELVKKNKK